MRILQVNDNLEKLGGAESHLYDLMDLRIETLNEQIEAEEEALDLIEEQADAEERLLNLEEARLALANAQAEKTVRMYNPDTGEFEWTADPSEVRDAQEDLAEEEADYNRACR